MRLFNLLYERKYCTEHEEGEYVSMSEEYLNDLMRMQQTVYAKIINDDLPLEYFDTFVQNWKRQGGDILLGNANRLKGERDAIFAKMGAGGR